MVYRFPSERLFKISRVFQGSNVMSGSFFIFSRFGCTALHQAVFFNRHKCAEIILENGGGINTQENWGLTPLAIASQKGSRYEMLKDFYIQL